MMNPKTKSQVLDDVAQYYSQNDIDLSSRILSRVHKEKVNIMKTKIVLSTVITMVVITAILFTIPGTAKAMRQILGFIPGIGLVKDDVPIRVLKESASIEREGTVISVVQGVIDAEHTILVYQVEKLPDFTYSPDSQIADICHQLPELKLPDGKVLSGRSESGKSWLSGYSRRIEFPALPADVNSAQLEFTCLERSMIIPDSPKWEVTMDFVQAPDDSAVYTPVDLPTPELPSTSLTQGEGSYASDIQLVIDRYVQTDEDLILFGNLKSISGNTRIESFEKKAVHLVDSNGVEIPLSEDLSLTNSSALTSGENSYPWAYRIESTYAAGQATLTIDSSWIRINDITSFTLDIGDNPQPGQKWTLDQSVNIAGREITIQDAAVNEKGDGISFSIVKPEDISGIILMDFDHPLLGGGGYESYGFTYRDGLPTGEINLTLASALLQISGPWEVKIDLPASVHSVTSAEGQTACLTQSSWQKAVEESAVLPEGLGGTLGISTTPPPDYLYRVMTSSLDGTNQKILSKGHGISLSPDGLQAIYNDNFGLLLMDLNTQTATPLADTGKNDGGTLWSPDGSKIAFTRGPSSGLTGAPGPYSIIIANPDGTQQEPVVENGDANTVMAWFPDGQSLLYTVTGPDGASVRSINIATGQITQLFEIGYTNTNVSLSSDGKRIAYLEMLPGDRYATYVTNIEDPTKSRLIVDAAPVVVTRPYWSPDGNWLIASVYDENISEDNSILTLIEPDTCQIVPLKNLSGHVTAWNP